jgi:hypothetical protein
VLEPRRANVRPAPGRRLDVACSPDLPGVSLSPAREFRPTPERRALPCSTPRVEACGG